MLVSEKFFTLQLVVLQNILGFTKYIWNFILQKEIAFEIKCFWYAFNNFIKTTYLVLVLLLFLSVWLQLAIDINFHYMDCAVDMCMCLAQGGSRPSIIFMLLNTQMNRLHLRELLKMNWMSKIYNIAGWEINYNQYLEVLQCWKRQASSYTFDDNWKMFPARITIINCLWNFSSIAEKISNH